MAEMIWSFGTGKDYTVFGTWITECASLMTNQLVFTHGGITGTLVDGDSVTGATSSATGTIVGAVTATQICLIVNSGTFDAGGEAIEKDASNHVTSTDGGSAPQHVLECYGHSTSPGYDAGVTDITGWTGLTASLTVEVRAPASERHDGVPDTGFAMTAGDTASTAFAVSQDHTTLSYIQLNHEYSGGNLRATLDVTGDDCVVHGCILKGSGGGSQLYGLRFLNNTGCRASCNFGLDFPSDVGAFNPRTHDQSWYNNVAKDSNSGFDVANNDPVLSNNICYGCTTSYYRPRNPTGNNNAADDAATTTPPCSNPITTDLVSGDFNDAAADNMQPESGGTAEDAGWDGSGVFTVDNTGLTWPATWHIGAWSTVNGGATGATLLPGFQHRNQFKHMIMR